MKLEKKTKQIIFTAFLLWAVILIFQFTDFDIEFQSIFYNFETKSWILSKAKNFLKKYSKTHEAGLLYVSDHGESLGENGIYLHGMPYAIAPKAQTHVASLIWLDNGQMSHEYDKSKIKQNKDKEYSHDNLFDTLLGLFEVKTEVYKKELDILNEARKEH